MKNIFRFFFVVFCLFTNTIPLHSQWVQTNGPATPYVKSLVVSGTNLFAGAMGGAYDDGVFLSDNNGASWTAVVTGLTNNNVQALAVSGPNLFAGTPNGIFLSNNNGTSWTAASTGLTNHVIYSFAVDGTNLFAGTDGGGVFGGNVYLSNDNGTNWSAVYNGLPHTNVRALAVSGPNLFAGTSNSGVFLSADNGTSWTTVNDGLTNTSVWALAVSGTNFFAGTSGGVFLSIDNGTSWTAASTGLTSTPVQAFTVSGPNLFAGTPNGVFFSNNNGTSWTAINTGLTNTFINALAVFGANLFAGTIDGGVWRRPLDEILPVELVSFNVTSEDKTVAISWSTATEVNNYGFEIERRTIKELPGQWNKVGFVQGSGTSNLPKEYSFKDMEISSGRYAYRLKQMDNDGTFKYYASAEVEVTAPQVFTFCQNYPNPFNPTTTIHFSIPSQSFVSLKIFDALGREVSILLAEELSAGEYTRQWNAANMPSGIYFYRLQAGTITATKKLVLLR